MMSTEPTGARLARADKSAEQASAPVRQWDSNELFGRSSEVVIKHRGVAYRLRRTSNGKLLLTK